MQYDPRQHQQRMGSQPPQRAYHPPSAFLPQPGQPPQRTYRTAARRQKSTFIHAILTFCTLGLWSPFWIMACAENARIRKAQAEVAAYEGRYNRA